MNVIHTLGHSTRPAAEFVGLLLEHGITVAVDVRRFPGSSRYPQFGREALSLELGENGMQYIHSPDLGGRRAPLPDSPNTAWRNSAFRGYADYMSTPGFRRALGNLTHLAGRHKVAIFCAEAVPWRCHRRLIADALVAQGIDVQHIMAPGRVDLHVLNEHARVLADGTIVYGPDIQPTLF